MLEPRVVPFSDHLALLDERRRLWERIEKADAELAATRGELARAEANCRESDKLRWAAEDAETQRTRERNEARAVARDELVSVRLAFEGRALAAEADLAEARVELERAEGKLDAERTLHIAYRRDKAERIANLRDWLAEARVELERVTRERDEQAAATDEYVDASLREMQRRLGESDANHVAAEARVADLEARLRPDLLAQRFHETYEALAPEFGYETRKESAVPWEQVPDANRKLMIAVCAVIASEVLEARLRHAGEATQ